MYLFECFLWFVSYNLFVGFLFEGFSLYVERMGFCEVRGIMRVRGSWKGIIGSYVVFRMSYLFFKLYD